MARKEHSKRERADLVRFGVSIEPELLERFDRALAEVRYSCRSEAIRDLIRERLAERRLAQERTEAIATLTLVYDHEHHHIAEELTRRQHDRHAEVVSTVHIHLDRHRCLEVLILRGRAGRIQKFADELIGVKGVKHGRLTITTAED